MVSPTWEQGNGSHEKQVQIFKAKIKTPEDFIRLAATESLLSGEPYMVKTKEGREMRCDEWMKKALKEYRDTKKNKNTEKKGP